MLFSSSTPTPDMCGGAEACTGDGTRGKLRGSASHSRLVLVLVNHHCEINPASPSPVYSTHFAEDLSCLNQKTDGIQTSLLPSFLRAEV